MYKRALEKLNKNYYLRAENFELKQFMNDLHNWLTWKAIPTLFTVSSHLSVQFFSIYISYFRTVSNRKEQCKSVPIVIQVKSVRLSHMKNRYLARWAEYVRDLCRDISSYCDVAPSQILCKTALLA
jgi:hypothetical protein